MGLSRRCTFKIEGTIDTKAWNWYTLGIFKEHQGSQYSWSGMSEGENQCQLGPNGVWPFNSKLPAFHSE